MHIFAWESSNSCRLFSWTSWTSWTTWTSWTCAPWLPRDALCAVHMSKGCLAFAKWKVLWFHKRSMEIWWRYVYNYVHQLYHVISCSVISCYIILYHYIMLYHVVSVSMLCLWFFGDLLVSIRGLSRRIRDTLSAWAFAAACVAVRVALKWSERRKT